MGFLSSRIPRSTLASSDFYSIGKTVVEQKGAHQKSDSVRIMLSVSLKMEVAYIVSTIVMMCLVAGTALLGWSGDMFPKPGGDGMWNQRAYR